MNRLLSPVMITALVFVAGFAICAAQFPNFASTRVVANLLTDNAFLGVVATGMTFVIISGGIDLSVGSVIAFTTVFIALTTERLGLPPTAAFAILLLLCAGFGAAMGAVIHFFDMPPFIVTLAGMFVVRGTSFLMSTESTPINAPLYSAVSDFGLALPGGGRLSAIALIMLGVVLGGSILLHFTRFGTNVYAIGGDRQSAALMGVPMRRTTVGVYAVGGFYSALGGVIYALYTASGYPLAGVGNELNAIAAVVLGGTLLTGGVGLVVGTLFGGLILGLIATLIIFDGSLNGAWIMIVSGLLLFAFILAQRVIMRSFLSRGV